MQRKKEKFLDKIVKKNYNNELELILEKKSFDEDAKNILLSVLYKLETAYKDYEKVKQNVMPKDEFLQMIISVIDNNVDVLKIVKINSEEAKALKNKSFLVDKENKTIICYPIERKVLYALSQIAKNDNIVNGKYEIIDKTISDLLNIGNNINTVEPMRDFNGFSWDTVAKEIESIEHNLIYQNLRILVGAKFLNDWIYNKNLMIDYYELFISRLQEIYGKKNAKKLIELICSLSVLLEMKCDADNLKPIKENKNKIEKLLAKIEDKEEFIKQSTKEKKVLNKKIRNIDTILNDKTLLQNEYEKRNQVLPYDKKIFSMRVLSNIMKKERKELVKALELQNELLNPQKFIKYKNELDEQYKYLKLLDETDINKTIDITLLELQKSFLECFKVKIQKAKTKEKLTKLLFEIRYYINLQYNKNKTISEIKGLNKIIEDVVRTLMNKTILEKVIIKISNNDDVNYNVLINILKSRIIDLANINIKVTKGGEEIYLQIFDEDIFENKLELCKVNKIELEDFQIKLNKNIRIFNL